MGFIGGDIIEATCSHPTLGDFRFQAKAGEAFTLDKGGYRSDDEAGGVTGNGKMIKKISAVRWYLEGPVAVDMLSDVEMSGLPALSASTDDGIWTLTHISGAIYKGTGCPVGDLNLDTNTAQLKLKVAGGGQMQMIA